MALAIKMIALDLDGTLLNSNTEISSATEQAIKKVKALGIKIVLATGRPLAGVFSYNQQLGLAGKDQYNVVFNGAVVQDLAGNIIINHKMNYNDFANMQKLQRLAKVNLHFETTACFWSCDHNLGLNLTKNAYLLNNILKIRELDEIKTDFTFNKATFSLIDDVKEVDQLWQNIPAWAFAKYDIVRSLPEIIEVSPQNVSKGSALEQLANRLQIEQNQIMVFGDQNNDLSMFTNPKFKKIAMGNAIDIIKDKADYVTEDNNHDGIAQALKKFIL